MINGLLTFVLGSILVGSAYFFGIIVRKNISLPKYIVEFIILFIYALILFLLG